MAYKILKDFKGSPDGIAVIEYTKGDIVPLAPSLAEVALEEKWVKEVADPATNDPHPEQPINDITGLPAQPPPAV
jgi:hypothetical protein